MKQFAVLLSLFIFLVLPTYAFACSCAGPAAPTKAFEDSEAVFTAHTLNFSKDKNGNAKEVTLHIDKVWKGDLPEKYSLDSSSLRNGCAYWSFKENKKYLVYAYKSRYVNAPGELDISMCSRTKPLEEAAIETRYLDTILAGESTIAIDQSIPEILISDEPENVRTEAAVILGWMVSQQSDRLPGGTVQALVAALGAPEKQVKLKAAQSLGRNQFAGKEGVAEGLLKLLEEKDWALKNTAANSLSMTGKQTAGVFEAVLEILKQAQQSEWKDQKKYESSLTSLGRSVAQLAMTEEQKVVAAQQLDMLIDKIHDPYNKVTIIQFLGFQREHATKSVPKILQTLKNSEHYHLKQYTIAALGDINATGVLDDIRPYLKDKNCYVVKSTVESFYKIDPEGFTEFFEREAMPELLSRYDKCDHQVIWTLQSIGDSGKAMKPFITEKFDAMEEGNWKKNSLKTLLEQWNKEELKP